jgi:PRTRC genetic system ThiF family protein
MNQLDLKGANARTLNIPSEIESLSVYLVGCGGTGSWLAPHLARYLRLFKEINRDTEIHLVFMDPDIVEEKNTFRQNFIPAEIGRNKAETLASRYTMSAGLEIIALGERLVKYNNEWDADMTVILGCVDNAAGRRSIAKHMNYGKYQEEKTFWIDCGNHKYSGQVLLSADGDDTIDPFALKGKCLYIPPMNIFHPELFEDEKVKELKPSLRLSCAEIAMIDHQSLSINTAIASIAAHYLAGLLLTGKIDKFETHFDLEGNSPYNHRFLVPEEFGAFKVKKSKKSKQQEGDDDDE